MKIYTLLTALVIAFGMSLSANAQPSPQLTNDALRAEISSVDTQLFDAVNRCDLVKVASFWANEAEFLHDQAPPMYGRDAIVGSIRENLCGKVQRELVAGSMEVYPLKEYGAVEIGVHRFLHPGAQDHGVIGEARFIHVWKRTPEGWQLTRVISIAHHTVESH